MQREEDRDEAAWAQIVANYGERAELTPEDEATPEPERPARAAAPPPEPEPDELLEDDDDAFEPPPPPPLDRPPADRLAAWLGVLGSPILLVVSIVAGISLPTWAVLLLAGAFVGGFGYLVARMPRSPRDPWDDGARV